MPLTRENFNYTNASGTGFFPSLAVSENLGVLGNSSFSGNLSVLGSTTISGFFSSLSTSGSRLGTTLVGLDNGSIELNNYLTSNSATYIDFHSSAPAINYDARIIRQSGIEGTFDIMQSGTGALRILSPQTQITSQNTSNTTFIVQAAATQTGDIGQWQNSSGTWLVRITSSGVLEAPMVTNAQAASYSLVLSDAGKLVEVNNASANNVTIPLNSAHAFPIGTQIIVLQTGAGQTTVNVTAGVTLNATPQGTANTAKLRAQWSSCTLIKRGTDTWVAVGDLVA